MAKFKVGDRVRCLCDIKFCDGTRHYKGFVYTVDAINIFYYNNDCNKDNYEVVK